MMRQKERSLGVVEVERLTTKYCELSTGVTTPSRVWGWMTRLFCPYLWEKTSVHPSKIGKELTIPEKCHFFSNASVWGIPERHFSGGSRLSREIMGFPPGLVPNVNISEEISPLHLRGRASHESPDVLRVAPSNSFQSRTRGSTTEGGIPVKGECFSFSESSCILCWYNNLYLQE